MNKNDLIGVVADAAGEEAEDAHLMVRDQGPERGLVSGRDPGNEQAVVGFHLHHWGPARPAHAVCRTEPAKGSKAIVVSRRGMKQ